MSEVRKNNLKNLFTFFLMILYKVVYIRENDSGYYLQKRKSVWFLLFIPILFYRMFINLFLEISNIFNEIFSYNKRCISISPTPKKELTFKQKRYITERLMS